MSPLAPTARSLLASRPARSRLAGGAALLLVVLALHAWLLGLAPAGWGPAPPVTTTRSGGPAMQVRAIVSPPTSTVSTTPVQPQTQTAAPLVTKRSNAVAAQPAATDAATHAAITAPAQAEASPVNSPADTPIPVYATQPAPATTLQYRLQRGLAVGTATLDWRPVDGGGYRLSLTTQAFGIDAISWQSVGQFDAAGLAPDRYSEARRGRELRASNFQKDAFQPQGGKLTFSAQATEHPLVPGMQDRLSWMLQLPAVLQANPALTVPGAQITLLVVGTRGAPEPWVFVVQEADSAGAPSSAPPSTVYLLREPHRPYDLRAHVWLDPQRHYLPVRMQLLVQATGEGNTFELVSSSSP